MAKNDSKNRKNTSDGLPAKNPATRSVKVKRDPEPAKKPTKKERKAKAKSGLSKTAKIVLVVIGVAAMVLSVSAVAISGVLSVSDEDDEDYELTGGVAATVNDVNITEDTISEYIMSIREAYGYDEDADWAQFLYDSGYTPETYREEIIQEYIDELLVTMAINEYEITVTDEEIDEEWNEAVESYGDEDSFLTILSYMGYDEDSYREALESSLQEEKLTDTVAPEEEVTDDQIVEYFNENLDSYNDTRRSSHILIEVEDTEDEEELAEAEAEAEEVLELIESGELTFEEAAAEYSDDSSAEDGGDVGWDCQSSFVDEYQEALDELEVDEVSGIVLSDYGYHIIMCTDYFYVEDSVSSVDEIPEDFQDEVSEILLETQVEEDYAAWLDEYEASADIEIFDMPEDVPYNVDMSLAEETDDEDEESTDEESSDDESTDEESTDESTDEETTDETSDDESTTEETAE